MISNKNDGLVWTNLPAKFDGRDHEHPTQEQVLEYLSNLSCDKRQKAEKYVRMAPRQIDTPYRRAIEAELGWTAIS